MRPDTVGLARSAVARTWASTRAALKRRPIARRINAWLEWTTNGGRMWREARIDARRAPSPDGFPLPSPRLRYRVHGRADQVSFLAVGRACAADIVSALAATNLEPGPGASVLDFGCGCGRVLRHLLRTRPGWRYTGIDIDREAIDWCRDAYPSVTFEATPPRPPTAFPDAQFDLVIGVSVFTHLDEDYQGAWLAELRRLLKPGGAILLSVRGEREQATLPRDDQERLRRDGFLYKSWRTGRLKLDGLPEFYQTTYHTRAYVERVWGRKLRVVAYLPAGINSQHDAVILAGPEEQAGSGRALSNDSEPGSAAGPR